MTLYSRVCLRCGGLQHWLHRCRADVMVVDPVMLQGDWRRTNPLDRLSLSDWMQIHGRDAEEERREAEAEIQAANDAYFTGSLTYRQRRVSVRLDGQPAQEDGNTCLT